MIASGICPVRQMMMLYCLSDTPFHTGQHKNSAENKKHVSWKITRSSNAFVSHIEGTGTMATSTASAPDIHLCARSK
jgi:hypothetical protein